MCFLPSSTLKWLYKNSPILVSFLKMHTDVTAVTVQSNKIVLNEVKTTKHYQRHQMENTWRTFWPTQSVQHAQGWTRRASGMGGQGLPGGQKGRWWPDLNSNLCYISPLSCRVWARDTSFKIWKSFSVPLFQKLFFLHYEFSLKILKQLS